MATLTTLESFTGGADGADPGYGSLLLDANGNLFGTTLSSGTGGGGTVFELVNTGSGYTFQTLASFDSTDTVNGNTPFAGLTMDAGGNLFGVTQGGGASGSGTVFELANTGSGYSLQTLASFSGANGASPMGTLLADADGDLFGVTQSGGANGQGAVFELVHSGSGYSLQTLYSFNYTDGAAPTGPLIADASGNLFGTTLQGGAGGEGTVFELVSTGSGYSLQTLASFDGSNGSFLYAGLTADAQGDLFGATYSGGSSSYGTVFELVNTGSGYAFHTIATLDYDASGGYAIGGLALDAQGDVFGTAVVGGAGGFGTVFELVNGPSGYSLQTLHTFSGADGALPEASLVLDAQGNLYGATAGGGDTGNGTVFEIAAAAPDNEQASLAVKVNGGSGAPIGAAGAHDVAFTVAGLATGDIGLVTFTDSANHTVAVEVTAGQTHYTADFSTLTDGAVSASLQVAANSAGDSFTPVAGNVVTLDTVAPGQPDAPADGSVVNGYVDAAQDTPGQTIGGAAEPGAGVAIYDNGSLVATVTADGSGAWSYQVGALADGSSHSYAVTATDAAGNVSALSEALSFTVDISAPAQPAAPADGAVVDGYVDAAHDTAGQAIGGVAESGASVAVYDNGGLVATVIADRSGAWSYQVGSLADGSSHSYAVTAADAAGNTSVLSGALSFTVDASAPAAPDGLADAAVAGGWVKAAGDGAGQSLTGTAEGGALVTIYDNGVKLGTATADGSGAWSFTLGMLADGAQALMATATDAAGNTGAASAALSFTVDTVAPASAVDQATVGGGGVVTVSGDAEAGSTVTLYDGGSLVGAVMAGAGGAWSYPVGVLADGSSHSWTVTATDAAGNVGAAGGALSFTAGVVPVDPPAQPAAPADAAVQNGYLNAVGDTAGQTIGGATEPGALVTIYDHGTQVTTVAADGSGAWSYQVGVLADGSSHSYTVTAANAGGASAMSGALSFVVDATPPPAPSGLADAAILGGYVNRVHDTAGQTLTGQAEGGALVTVYDNGVKLGTATANASTGGWSFTLGTLADGAQSLTATATDAAGNTGPASALLAFTVDATAPVPVVTNVTDAGKGQSTVSGTSEAGSTVTLFDGGQPVGVATAGADGAWSVTLKLNGGSTHAFTETAVDRAGNGGASTGAAYWANPANKAFVGSGGDDVFIGGKGDTLTGGAGHDHFVFNSGSGSQTVTNFACGSDQLWFDHAVFGAASQVLAHAQQSGANAVITAGGDQVVLQGVQCSALHAEDFHFF